MKKLIFVLTSIILLLCLCSCSSASNNNFEICTEDFEEINKVLLSIETEKDRTLFSVVYEKERVTEIYNFPVELNENQLLSINKIADAITTDFSFMEITEKRISYGGEGSDMLVYSIDGKKPKYFYYEGDKVDFSAEKLGHNWYFCHAKIR